MTPRDRAVVAATDAAIDLFSPFRRRRVVVALLPPAHTLSAHICSIYLFTAERLKLINFSPSGPNTPPAKTDARNHSDTDYARMLALLTLKLSASASGSFFLLSFL